MKKFNKFGYAGAIALATAMSFSACSSDDEMENINPSYDGSSVKTQFAISLTQKAKKGGRMTSEEVGNVTFTTIGDVKLYHLASEATGASTIGGIVSSVTAINDFNYQDSGNKLNGNVYNITIPTGTSHFLFYGQNPGATTGETVTSYPETPAGAQVSGITFTPSKILKGTNLTDFNSAYEGIITTLNKVYTALTEATLPGSIKAEAVPLSLLKTASSVHILTLVEEIYNSVAVQYEGIPNGSADKAKVKDVLDAIEDAGFTATGSSAPYTLTWTTDPQFPTYYGLPSGAVAVKFASTAFAKVDAKPNTQDGSQGDYKLYAKPANLMYFANSPAGVRNSSYFDHSQAVTDASEAQWKDVSDNFTAGSVSATTRSVILMNQVNYGVAQLQTKVQFKEDQILDQKGTEVAIPAGGFQVTGILIGNQKQVDWKFNPIGTDLYTIYDAAVPATMKAAKKPDASTDNYSAVNYTLVYETQDATSTADTESDIRVAIELVNGATEFYGEGGQRVPANAKFYVVGVLHVGTQYADDAPVKSVFKQDYITTANFTISTLASAYNVIPDLATPKMEFGMSVDIAWKDGLTFNVEI